ncbi:MAG: hypothetical protein WA185_04780 [Candidatus Acidiferrales bacterium]
MHIESNRAAKTGIIVAMAMALVLGAPAIFAQSSQQQQDQDAESFQRSFPMSSGGTLEVENRKGTIHVTGSDTNQVVVSVHKIFTGGSDKGREWWMKETTVNFGNEPNRLDVRVEYPNWNCVFCVSVDDEVDLTIAVPRQTNIELDGNRPDMAISSIDGNIRISSNRSAIAIKSTSGAIRIETNRGDVRLSDVAIQGRLDLTSNRADAVIEAKSLAGYADLETERGSIVVRMPSTVGVNLDYVGGRRASFHCDFPVTTNENGTELNDVSGRVGRDGARISGAVNQGGARMTLRTERGSISIEKAS